MDAGRNVAGLPAHQVLGYRDEQVDHLLLVLRLDRAHVDHRDGVSVRAWLYRIAALGCYLKLPHTDILFLLRATRTW